MKDDILLTKPRADSRVELLSEVQIVADSDETAAGVFQRSVQAGQVVQQTISSSGHEIVDFVQY